MQLGLRGWMSTDVQQALQKAALYERSAMVFRSRTAGFRRSASNAQLRRVLSTVALLVSLLARPNHAGALSTNRVAQIWDDPIMLRIASRDAARRGVNALLTDYINYLYLSQLFGKPTATHMHDHYCVDQLHESLIEIALAATGLGRRYWRLRCSPVRVRLTAVDPNARNRLWNVHVRFISFSGSEKIIAALRHAIEDPNSLQLTEMSTERQLELADLYNLPPNFFLR
jgi:hypothetical protein